MNNEGYVSVSEIGKFNRVADLLSRMNESAVNQ